MNSVTPFITFESGGKAAIEMYMTIFKDSALQTLMTAPDSDHLLFATFTLNGQTVMAMDGGPEFSFTDGFSWFVNCDNQEEIDYYSEALTAEGGKQGRCGWLKDRFGLSWQIIPKDLGELMQSGDPEQGHRVMEAMLKMDKLDIQGLRDAAAAN